jgi:hypothetical protein
MSHMWAVSHTPTCSRLQVATLHDCRQTHVILYYHMEVNTDHSSNSSWSTSILLPDNLSGKLLTSSIAWQWCTTLHEMLTGFRFLCCHTMDYNIIIQWLTWVCYIHEEWYCIAGISLSRWLYLCQFCSWCNCSTPITAVDQTTWNQEVFFTVKLILRCPSVRVENSCEMVSELLPLDRQILVVC